MPKTILLADDSVTIQKVVELTFMDGDYEIDAVGSGDEALVRLQDRTPDFVIADVHMPGASGYEVARAVKSSHPHVPVLLLVGTFEPFDPEEVEAAGADGHLKKPFDSQELLRLVEDLSASAAAPEAAPQPTAEPEPVTQEVPPPPVVQPLPSFGAVERPVAEAEPELPSLDPESIEGLPSSLAAPEPEEVAPPASPDLAPEPPPDAPSAAVETGAAAPAAAADGSDGLSDEEVERIARRVAELVGESVLREVAWEVVPDMAEVVVKDRLRELETQAERQDT